MHRSLSPAVDPAGLARAWELVRRRGAVAQLYVLHDGEVVLDRAIGCRADSLFWIFSAGKPFVAMLVHLLAQRGALDLDDPVAAYWPGFGRNGKAAITIRQVLRHRAGLPTVRGTMRDALAAARWERAVRDVERARPAWPPGQVPAYHILSYGVILGELVRRVSGVPVDEFLSAEVLDPLGLRDVHLGLPGELWHRRVPVRGRGLAARLTQLAVNRRATRAAVVPAAGVSCTARDLALFYEMLRRDGELGGVRVFEAATVAAARRPSSDGEIDRFIHLPIRWSEGFQLGGPGADPAAARPMGRLSSPETFGHNGSNCCLGWVDPARGLVVAYLSNLLMGGHRGARHMNEVSDAIIAACPLRNGR